MGLWLVCLFVHIWIPPSARPLGRRQLYAFWAEGPHVCIEQNAIEEKHAIIIRNAVCGADSAAKYTAPTHRPMDRSGIFSNELTTEREKETKHVVEKLIVCCIVFSTAPLPLSSCLSGFAAES